MPHIIGILGPSYAAVPGLHPDARCVVEVCEVVDSIGVCWSSNLFHVVEAHHLFSHDFSVKSNRTTKGKHEQFVLVI